MDYVHEKQVGRQAGKQVEEWKCAIVSFLGPVEFKSMIIMKFHKKNTNPAQTLRKHFEPHEHAMHVISP